MKGTKQIAVGLGIMLAAGLAFADAKADFNAAMTLYNAAKLDDAYAAFSAIPDYGPARLYAGHCLNRTRRFAEAEAVYKSARPLLPKSVNLELAVARSQYNQKKFADAENTLRAAATLLDGVAPKLASELYWNLSDALRVQHKSAGQNEALLQVILTEAQKDPAVSARAVAAFNRLRPALMSNDQHADTYSTILRAFPATEANTDFLGKVKSEALKLQK